MTVAEIVFWIFIFIMSGICGYQLGYNVGIKISRKQKDKSE